MASNLQRTEPTALLQLARYVNTQKNQYLRKKESKYPRCSLRKDNLLYLPNADGEATAGGHAEFEGGLGGDFLLGDGVGVRVV